MTMEEKKEGMNCKHCNKELGSRDLQNHVYECKKLEVKCPYCA
jgi:Zn finger protein HypA/HybF involved in hydrogenase expression